MDAQTLSLLRTWIVIANVRVISLPSMAGTPVLGISVYLNIRLPVFSLLAVC